MRLSRILKAVGLCLAALGVGWLGWLVLGGGLSYEPLRVDAPGDGSANGYPWFGAVHVHSALSADASGSIEEIVAAAEEVGLDFVVVADHTGSLGAAGRVDGGWKSSSGGEGDVLVLVGEEISTDAGHLLALGIRPHPFALGPTAGQALRDIRALGGDAFLAHPNGGESAWRAGWGSTVGAEIASLSSALAVAPRWQLVGALLTYPFNPDAAMLRLAGPAWTSLEPWDRRMASGHRSAGIGSVDAHGPIGRARFPSYSAAFRALTTVVWMPEPPPRLDPEHRRQSRADAARVTEALVAGRAATAILAAGRPTGLYMEATSAAGASASPGQVVDLSSGPWSLAGGLGGPGAYGIELLHDGEAVATSEGGELVYPITDPGAYRLEVRRTDLHGDSRWVVTNPIYVWDSTTVVASRVQPAPPLPAPPIDLDLLPLPGWVAEADRSARSAMAPGAGGLVWDVRMPNEVLEDRYAAIAWRAEVPLDWSAAGGLVARLRSEREWRVSLRLWTRDAAGEQRTWERVIRSTPEGAVSAAPWSHFRRIDRPGAPVVTGVPIDELARVDGVALVVTPQLMRPGSEAQFDLEAIGRFDP